MVFPLISCAFCKGLVFVYVLTVLIDLSAITRFHVCLRVIVEHKYRRVPILLITAVSVGNGTLRESSMALVYRKLGRSKLLQAPQGTGACKLILGSRVVLHYGRLFVQIQSPRVFTTAWSAN